MDVFSHFVLPFLAVYAVRRRRPEALAAGIGGFAPDLDAITFPLAFWDPLYFMGHRGVSHTLLGAPLFALGAVLLLRAPFWGKLIPIASELRFTPRLVAIAVAASFTHLLLDWTTMWGVALLFPWSPARVTADWFFYSVPLMIPFSAYFVWRVARGTLTARTLCVAGALVLAALVLSAGVRAATHREGDISMPAAGEWAWTTLDETPEGWDATFWSWGHVVGQASYSNDVPDDAAARAALETARAHVEFRAFQLYTRGPIVVHVEAREDEGWNVTFLDLMARTQADRSPWMPFGADAGLLRLAVVDARVDVLD